MKTTEFDVINQYGEKIKASYAFFPAKLEVEDRPELRVFPLNIMIVSYKRQGDKVISGTALYNPEMESYTFEDGVRYFVYTNQFKNEQTLIVAYHPDTGGYEGVKVFDGVNMVYVYAEKYNEFFLQLQGGGLTDNEGCRFDEIKPRKD